MEIAEEGEEDDGEEDNKRNRRGKEAEEEKEKKTWKKNKATNETLSTIVEDCDDFLAFLQAVAVKFPRVIKSPLSLCADKHAHIWFCRWSETNLLTPTNTSPQDHTYLMGVLRNVATRLQTAESLHPVVAAHRYAEKKIRDGTVSPKRPNKSSWWQAPPTEPRFRPRCHPPFTVSLTQGTQQPYTHIAPSPTQGTISTYQPPFAKPSFKETSWKYQTWMLQQDYCRS